MEYSHANLLCWTSNQLLMVTEIYAYLYFVSMQKENIILNRK